MALTIKQLNEQLFASKVSVGSKEHCGCEDCAFYAHHIMKNRELVTFLRLMGIDAQKADEAWCYNTDNGYKYYRVDFFRVHADMERTVVFGDMKIIIFCNHYAKNHEPSYGISLEGALSD